MSYYPDVDATVTATAIGVGGTVLVAASGFWASVRNTSQTVDSARQARISDWQEAQRAEVKNAIASYLEIVQHLQTMLNDREHGKDVGDLGEILDRVWLAQKQVDIICSVQLREPLVQHATALHMVTKRPDDYRDWWAYITPYQENLLEAIRIELARLPNWQMTQPSVTEA